MINCNIISQENSGNNVFVDRLFFIFEFYIYKLNIS